MKLLILSDSHREMAAMRKAVRTEQPDAIVHLGDHYADAQALHHESPDIPLYAVEGNTDYAPGAQAELLLPLENKRIYMTHGHFFNVKSGLSAITQKGASVAADLVLFGHTHLPLCREENGMLLLNPGSVGCPRGFGRREAAYAVAMITADGIVCTLKTVEF